MRGAEPANEAAILEVTNVHQIRLVSAQTSNAAYAFRLEGDVWWANTARGAIVLKDDSGVEELEMDLVDENLKAGQRVRVEGKGTVTPVGAGFRLGAMGPVVDNDGVHSMVEKSGAVFLKAGRNPIRVEWFNGVEKYGLEVEYEGQFLPRRKIPDSVLFRAEVNKSTGETNWVNGLDFECFEVNGERLPEDLPRADDGRRVAVSTNARSETPHVVSYRVLDRGTVENFDVRVMARPEHVGIRFTGFIEVPTDGVYTFYTKSDDGSRLFAGEPSVRVEVLGLAAFPEPQVLAPGQLLGHDQDGWWVEIEGKVTFASEKPDGLKLELNAGTGTMRVEVARPEGLSAASVLNRHVRATGVCQSARTVEGRKAPGVLLVPGGQQIKPIEPPSFSGEGARTNRTGLPLLVTAAEIHRLRREEAERKYPVKITGVVTSLLPEHQAFTLQDATRGIYVNDPSQSRWDPPRIGEFLAVEGTSDPGMFAPVVEACLVRTLGAGTLPEPIRPTRDQLMNGSLDAQYVELEGILTSLPTNGVVLLTSAGRIKVDLRVTGMKAQELACYEDALIRVRGCLFATWDYVTHRVNMDEIRINGADVAVEQPAPKDLFSTPKKMASELLLFDPRASLFQRVLVAGQVVHIRDPECFIMDGSSGVRFVAKHPVDLQIGDLVEAVGFPELDLAAPVLREAVARKTGHGALPKPKPLGPDEPVRPDLDSTRVQLKGVLVNQRNTASERLLEMRVGFRPFLARTPATNNSVQTIPAGSLLELTGTYAAQGLNQQAASFELLLNSPADIAVLARPPWWTLERLLIMLGALGCILAMTVLWITQLRRNVEERTAELAVQIREREHVEQQRVMEQERTRIARDLHDELGSGLTEISMLAARARPGPAAPESRGSYLEQMGDKARQMVAALDEIVWAMNPTHDSLASMISYFSLYAERFLGLANIGWRLESPFRPDDHAVDSQHRHELFLAFKEALNNVVRHSGATEVSMNIQVDQGHVCLTITDNGRGWGAPGRVEETDGLVNMRARLQKMGGRFEVNTRAGQGTVVRFNLPLN